MKNEWQNIDEHGVSLPETLLVVSVLFILITAAMLHGSSMYRNAILNYETHRLVSDLKLLQKMSRTATYDRTNFPLKESPPVPLFMELYWDSYRIRPIFESGITIRRHYFPPNISVSRTNTEYLGFQPNGDTTHRRMGSILLFWRNKGDVRRRIVIDTAGRIRVER